MQPILIISLDFELHWGGFEKWSLAEFRQYFLNTRQVIPRMLEAMERSGVHATWATVGLLFNRTLEEAIRTHPLVKPGFFNQALSAYRYMAVSGIGRDEKDDPFHYAPSLIERIGTTPGMEVASHTYAHYYAGEPGQTIDQFRADLQAARIAAERIGYHLHSLVLPRNQVNTAYLTACAEEGFTTVRSNPDTWYWRVPALQPETLWKRFNRGTDAYWLAGPPKTFRLDQLVHRAGEPLLLPASRFLRPHRKPSFGLNELRLKRVQMEMNHAAREAAVYHLWWHPHNFGLHPEESMQDLERILAHYRRLREECGMLSLNMSEVHDLYHRQSPAT